MMDVWKGKMEKLGPWKKEFEILILVIKVSAEKNCTMKL